MINLKPIVIASAALLLLNACSGNSSSSSGGAVSVAAVSGVDADLSGNYLTDCYGSGASFTKEELTISGNTWNYTQTEYSDSGCTTVTDSGAISGTFAIDGTVISITGWVDGSGANVNSTALADDGSLMSATQDITPLSLTIGSSSGSLSGIPGGTSFPFFYVVDDTGASNMLYRDDDFETGSTEAGYYDPYTKQ